MGIYDDAFIHDFEQTGFGDHVKVLIDPAEFLDTFERKFVFDGSKIDWTLTDNHCTGESNNESLLQDAIHFINRIKEKYLNNSTRVLYIGDRLTEYGYLFELKDLDKILICILDIPQHHYIFPEGCEWCLCISTENYLDFGFSLKS